MAVAEASFSTVNDSMSSTFTSLMSRSKPSTSTRADWLAPKVDMLRTQNSDTSPGTPLLCMAMMPGTTPASPSATEVDGVVCSWATSTVVTAPVTAILRCAPRPVMTTSSRMLSWVSFICTFTTRCSFTSIVCLS